MAGSKPPLRLLTLPYTHDLCEEPHVIETIDCVHDGVTAASMSHAADCRQSDLQRQPRRRQHEFELLQHRCELGQPGRRRRRRAKQLVAAQSSRRARLLRNAVSSGRGGRSYTSCVLNTQGPSGGAIQFTFTSVYVSARNRVRDIRHRGVRQKPRMWTRACCIRPSRSRRAEITVDDGGTKRRRQDGMSV